MSSLDMIELNKIQDFMNFVNNLPDGNIDSCIYIQKYNL